MCLVINKKLFVRLKSLMYIFIKWRVNIMVPDSQLSFFPRIPSNVPVNLSRENYFENSFTKAQSKVYRSRVKFCSEDLFHLICFPITINQFKYKFAEEFYVI